METEPGAAPTDFATFRLADLRVGTVRRAEPAAGARPPALRLWIDFGPLGERRTQARLAALYDPAALVGRQVVAAVNLGARRVGGFESEVLVLGLPDDAGAVVVLAPERAVPDGVRVF